MKQCSSIAKNGERCKKTSLPLSRYCLFHQDLFSYATFIFFAFTIALTLLIFSYQNKQPDLKVTCDIMHNPNEAKIVIRNHGRLEASNVIVNFSDILPVGTEVHAPSEYNISMKESETILNPNEFPEYVQINTAFSIVIPRVPGKDSVYFTVISTDSNIQRASDQILRLREIKSQILCDFIKEVVSKYPQYKQEIEPIHILNYYSKKDNLFTPYKYSYEKGIFHIKLYSKKENECKLRFDNIYGKYKKEFIDVFKSRGAYYAPVVRVKTKDGYTNFAVFPPFVQTYIDMIVPVDSLMDNGHYNTIPAIPKSYTTNTPSGHQQ